MIGKWLGRTLAALLPLWALFYILFTLPNPFVRERDIPLKRPAYGRSLRFDLIAERRASLDSELAAKDPWVRPDAFAGGLQASLGKYLWLVESRRALPAGRCPAFVIRPANSSILTFGIGVRDRGSRFHVRINGATVFARTLRPKPRHDSWLYRRLIEPFRFRVVPQGGFWEDVRLALAPWAGKSVAISIGGDSGFISAPQVTEQTDRRSAPPNIILIQIDALRPDIVEREELPGLRRLKRGGAYFRNAYSAANWTRPANLVQFFGRRNSELGISSHDYHIHPLEKAFFYRQRFLSLPLFLAQRGYADAAIGDNIFLHGFSQWGVDVGFSAVQDFERIRYESVAIVEQAVDWIDRQEGRPFFLFLDFNQTHSPYKPPLQRINWFEVLRQPRFAFYKGCLRYVDDFLDRFVEKLRSGGYLQNTLLVVNADHGENFANFGRPKLDASLGNSRVAEHSSSLWQEEIRIPLLFYWPGKIPARVLDSQVSLIDVPRTILGLTGWTPPPEWGGRDLAPVMRGAEPDGAAPPVLVEGKNELSLIAGRYQYIARSDCDRDGELYDIARDPLNRHDLALQRPDLAARLRRLLLQAYPPPYPVWVVHYNLPAGRVGRVSLDPAAVVKFFGADRHVKRRGPAFDLQGQGHVYWVFSQPPAELRFSGGRLRLTPLQIPCGPEQSETVLPIASETLELLANPYRNPGSGSPGFWLYRTPVLSWVKDIRLNPQAAGGEGMKQILIDWGYVKK